MEKNSNINELFSVWKEFSKEDETNKLEFELEIYKKLLRLFQVGDYFYVIFNLNLIDFEYVSSNVEKILGCHSDSFTLEHLLNCIHPEDIVWFATFEKETARFLKELPSEQLFDYKIQYDLRLKCSNNQYKRLLFQVIVIHLHADGGIQRTLSLFTDITHLKDKGNPVLSFINIKGGNSYINVSPGKKLVTYKDNLSKREKEILQYIIAGKLNKEIAEILFISKQTVDKHRKNMLAKTQSKNSGELIGKAINKGWI